MTGIDELCCTRYGMSGQCREPACAQSKAECDTARHAAETHQRLQPAEREAVDDRSRVRHGQLAYRDHVIEGAVEHVAERHGPGVRSWRRRPRTPKRRLVAYQLPVTETPHRAKPSVPGCPICLLTQVAGIQYPNIRCNFTVHAVCDETLRDTHSCYGMTGSAISNSADARDDYVRETRAQVVGWS
jgi:hypothetical protein